MDEQAKREANKALAVALGYTVKRSGFVNGYGASVVGYRLFRPDGLEVVNFDDFNSDLGGYGDEATAWQVAPDFYGSVDAALETLPDGEDAVLLYPPPGEGAQHTARIVGLNGDATAHGATRAEALANARLSMAEAEAGGEDGGDA